MADIDSTQLGGSYDEHYALLDHWTDFELLQYWLLYNGVFDGGEGMLNELKRLCVGDPRCNTRSDVQNQNI